MSRLAAYINKDVMEREDVDMLMSDDSQNINIYRYPDAADGDGFRQTTPKRALALFKVVRGRIDRRDRIYQAQAGEVSKSVDALYIATIYFKDLRTDDILEMNNQKYTVKFVNKIGQSFTEAEVEVQT